MLIFEINMGSCSCSKIIIKLPEFLVALLDFINDSLSSEQTSGKFKHFE
jgi:hypothetical protein